MSQKEIRKRLNIVPAIVGLLVLIAVIAICYAYFNRKPIEVYSFADCVVAGYPIMETYPEQCRTPDGRTFIASTTSEGIDPTGDGATSAPAGWVTTTDTSTGITFAYPENASTRYVTYRDWPPQLQVLRGPFTCTEAGLPTDRAGRTELRMVGGVEYCVTRVSEGAAGSIYIQYAYGIPKDDKVVMMTFTTQMPQCVNFDEPARAACEQEQSQFDADILADRIARTMTF